MFPRGVLIYITNDCNLRCAHCGVVNKKNSRYMSSECFYKIMDFLKKKKSYIVAISGGDPILHPELFEFIEHIRKCNMLPVLGLSGVGINDEQIEKIANSGLGCVQVSLDGSNEEVNSIFRGKNVFNEVVNNIKKLQEKNVRVNLAFCLCRENAMDFDNMLELSYMLKVYEIKVQFWEKTGDNNIFHELDKNEKELIIEKSIKFVKDKNLKDWLALDINFETAKYQYLKEDDVEKKCIFFPNGDVKETDSSNSIVGNIMKNYEEVERYYEG